MEMKKYLSFLLSLLLLVGCSPKGKVDSESNSTEAPRLVEEVSLTMAPTAAPTATLEPTSEPTPEPTATPAPLHLTREEVAKYKDCVVMPEGYSAPEYLVVTHRDGTISAGLLYDFREAESWRDIVAISAAENHVAGLKRDGTVVAVGSNNKGQLLVQGWTDITALATGNDFTVGLRADGTVVVAGDFTYAATEISLSEALSSWTDIVAITAASNRLVLGLKADGTVVYFSSFTFHVEDWTDIVSIAASENYVAGLRSDGTVVTAVLEEFKGDISKNALAVEKWTDVTSIFIDSNTTFGVQSDGTVLVAGDKDIVSKMQNKHNLLNIVNGRGLQANGTVCSLYGYGYIQSVEAEITTAQQVKEIAASGNYFFILREDGSVLVTGHPNYKVESVNGWQNLKFISGKYGITREGTLVGSTSLYPRNIVSCHEGTAGFAAVYEDGTVYFEFPYYLSGDTSSYDVSGWNNITQVVVGSNFVLGLKADGTVLCVGENADVQGEISQWSNVKKLYVDPDRGLSVIGVTHDNTLLTIGLDSTLQTWTEIADVAMGVNTILGLKTDGSVTGNTDAFDTDISKWQNLTQLVAGYSTMAGLRSDGTVITAKGRGSNENPIAAAESWTDIVSLNYYQLGWEEVLWGLKSDGSVVSTGTYPPRNEEMVQAVASDEAVLGLHSDGTVEAFYPTYIDWIPAQWQNLTQLVLVDGLLLGVKEDGTVIAAGELASMDGHNYNGYVGEYDISKWKDIKEIVSDSSRYVGLKEDGTVVMAGDGSSKIQGSLNSWRDVVQVVADNPDCVGLKGDGTVVLAGTAGISEIPDSALEEIAGWQDIVKVALSSWKYVLGLKGDGRVEFTWTNPYRGPSGEEKIGEWTDIVDIIATETHAVGLRSDGTVVAAGENDAGQCNVESWTNIVAIYATREVTVGLTAEGTLRIAGNFDPSSNTVLALTDIGVNRE